MLWINPKFAEMCDQDELHSLKFPWSVRSPFGRDEDVVPKEGLFEAHNAEFERAIWHHIMTPQFGWPEIPIERWRCTAAKAAVSSLPRGLGKVSEVLGLAEQKDEAGHRIMMRLCKPKPANQRKNGDWDEDPEKLIKLFKYCVQDVNTEHAVSENVRDLTAEEQEMWVIDQRINMRGVNIDITSVDNTVAMVELEKAKLVKRCEDICGIKPTRIQQLLKWTQDQGVKLDNYRASTLTDMLAEGLAPADVLEVAQIRKSVGKSSTAKLIKMQNCVGTDNRARGLHMFNGAGTGRWAGKLIQLQNVIRAHYEDVEACLALINAGDYGMVEMLYDPPIVAASKIIRAMVTATPGNILRVSDFKSVEGRVLAWLACDDLILASYREGMDLYKVAASGAFGVAYNEIDKPLRQVGKVIELACGFQGHWRAFQSMASVYGVEPPEDVVILEKKELRDFDGKSLSTLDARFKKWATPFITAWRKSRPKTVKFWYALQDAVFEAIRKPGKTLTVGYLKIGTRKHKSYNYLHIRLPSGRRLNYFDPRIANVTKVSYEEYKDSRGKLRTRKVEKVDKQISYMSVHSTTGQWLRLYSYGGKLAENVTQAVANDLLRFSITNHENEGYPICFHVHDEEISETPEDYGSQEEFEEIMTRSPEWAEGLPIEVDGFSTKRYRK